MDAAQNMAQSAPEEVTGDFTYFNAKQLVNPGELHENGNGNGHGQGHNGNGHNGNGRGASTRLVRSTKAVARAAWQKSRISYS